MNCVIVTPTYNERANLLDFTARVLESAPGADLLIVDDNSPDGTGELAEELAEVYGGRVKVLHRGRKEGLGRAYVAGFREALAQGYEAIVQMDADLSHDPAYLPDLLNALENADLVLGSRYLRGINVVAWDFKRLLLSKLATAYVRLILRIPFTDATGGYKCWRAQALRAVGLDKVVSNGYLFQIEMTHKAFQKGLRVAEIPIIFYEREVGRSKIDPGIIWEAFWGVLRFGLGGLLRRIPKTAPPGVPATVTAMPRRMPARRRVSA